MDFNVRVNGMSPELAEELLELQGRNRKHRGTSHADLWKLVTCCLYQGITSLGEAFSHSLPGIIEVLKDRPESHLKKRELLQYSSILG